MNFSSTMAAAAVAGILAGTAVACGGEQKPASDPATSGAKTLCSGKNGCGGAAMPAATGTAAAPVGTGGAKMSCSGAK
jgi:hypothetical protein